MSKIMMFSAPLELVLASSSRYRRLLLDRLGVPYTVDSPDVDEAPLRNEQPVATAMRLASAKARAVSTRNPKALIIGADQVATLDGTELIGKPLHHGAARAQLARLSGRTVRFHTAVCLLNSDTQRETARLVTTEVLFRELDEATIESYLNRDQPYDCTGSARIESLGIALVKAVNDADPTALLGLPLIALIDLLADEGVRIL
jgi:septum formation protein